MLIKAFEIREMNMIQWNIILIYPRHCLWPELNMYVLLVALPLSVGSLEKQENFQRMN